RAFRRITPSVSDGSDGEDTCPEPPPTEGGEKKWRERGSEHGIDLLAENTMLPP
ncbi:hypothetical protein KUCAC02_036604, partial [Chaenocephalus aceratus]